MVPASSGLCIQLRNGTIYTAEPSGAKEQQWFIERGESGQIAFRNAKDGQYLRAVGGGRGARIVTGQEQYWRLESSNTPNAFWCVSSILSSTSFVNSLKDKMRRFPRCIPV